MSALDTVLFVAPMAGGPSTVALVRAAAGAGAVGFLAGGYKTVDTLAAEVRQVRDRAFGVNLFAPNPLPVDPTEYATYRHVIAPAVGDAGSPDVPRQDDDGWEEKLDLLLHEPVPYVSFTFGIPPSTVITKLQRAGTVVIQTVTSAAEAQLAQTAGVDVLAVQASAAGGHSGTLTPALLPPTTVLHVLLGEVRAAVSLPLVAAGGLATPEEVAAVVGHSADAVMVGTVLLLSEEAGTSAPYRRALAAGGRDTLVTRAFTGRPARALRNGFTDAYSTVAPLGYPALHFLTIPMRRAAAVAGDPERINLWAGTGYEHASVEPAGAILCRLQNNL